MPLSHSSICEILSVKNDLRYRVSNITPGLYLSSCSPSPEADMLNQVAALLINKPKSAIVSDVSMAQRRAFAVPAEQQKDLPNGKEEKTTAQSTVTLTATDDMD